MRRALPVILVALVGAVVAYQLLLGEDSVAPSFRGSTAVATIGSGENAVAVAADGSTLDWLRGSDDLELPVLPLDEPPEGGRLRGPMLDQVRVLGAAPTPLRPHIAATSHGEEGVVVVLRAGIELRFGDTSQLRRKWNAAAAVLADPGVEALDYVNLQAPGHPAVGGSGHALAPPP